MGGWTPNHKLHDAMARVCKDKLGDGTLTDKDLARLPIRERVTSLRPDLLLGNVALECHTIAPEALGRMEAYKGVFPYLILCLPIPKIVDEVWFYSIEDKQVSHVITNHVEDKDTKKAKKSRHTS